jgi:DNA-binding response OmpR family regulator
MNGKIMGVYDEEFLVELLIDKLCQEGYTTFAAYGSNEVWQMIMQEKPDLIILDLMLPGKNGFEICKDLRRANINTTIIIMTARDNETDRILALEMGADDFMIKPYRMRELLSRIKALLRINLDEVARGSSISN